MPFDQTATKVEVSINTVEIGCGDKAIKLGGESEVLSYTFDVLLTTHQRLV